MSSTQCQTQPMASQTTTSDIRLSFIHKTATVSRWFEFGQSVYLPARPHPLLPGLWSLVGPHKDGGDVVEGGGAPLQGDLTSLRSERSLDVKSARCKRLLHLGGPDVRRHEKMCKE